MTKVLLFDKSEERYIKLANKRIEEKDYVGALALLFSVMEKGNNYKIYAKIAGIYSEIEQYELSNKFWFKYMFYAPKDRVSSCYESIASNFYELNNLWGAAYYINQKFMTDGELSKELENEEILEYLSGNEKKDLRYRVVYPYDKADYKLEIESARQAIQMNDFKSAVSLFESVPLPCLDEEGLNDFAVAYMMVEDYDSAEQVARESIKRYGETLGAFCNLSTISQMKKDDENCKYYYEKALSLRGNSEDEHYKILNPAIETGDHKTIKECLEKILIDRPNDLTIRFHLALAFVNLYEYDKGLKELIKIYQYNPNDFVVEYYLNIVKRIIDGDSEKERLLPLEYLKAFPKKIIKKYENDILRMLKNPERISQEIKKESVKKLLTWGLTSKEVKDEIMRSSAMVLSVADDKTFKEIAFDILLNPEVSLENKGLIVYALILRGYKGKIAHASGVYYAEILLKKLAFSEGEESRIYLTSYALCVSRMIFRGVEDLSKMTKATNYLYKTFGKTITSAEVNNEELAGLILLHSGEEKYKDEKTITRIFEVSATKLKKLKNLTKIAVKEQKND